MKGILVKTDNGWVVRIKPSDEKIREMINGEKS